jgi:hypothetical protein
MGHYEHSTIVSLVATLRWQATSGAIGVYLA